MTFEQIRNMKPGTFKPFICQNGAQLQSAATMVSQIKRLGMPDGVVDYEVQKFFEDNIILVHALGEGENKVLNR